MQLPNVVHPTTFQIQGVQIQVIAYFPLTDQQAALIATYLWRTQAQVRRAKGKRVQPMWTGDRQALAALEAAAAGAG